MHGLTQAAFLSLTFELKCYPLAGGLTLSLSLSPHMEGSEGEKDEEEEEDESASNSSSDRGRTNLREALGAPENVPRTECSSGSASLQFLSTPKCMRGPVWPATKNEYHLVHDES